MNRYLLTMTLATLLTACGASSTATPVTQSPAPATDVAPVSLPAEVTPQTAPSEAAPLADPTVTPANAATIYARNAASMPPATATAYMEANLYLISTITPEPECKEIEVTAGEKIYTLRLDTPSLVGFTGKGDFPGPLPGFIGTNRAVTPWNLLHYARDKWGAFPPGSILDVGEYQIGFRSDVDQILIICPMPLP